MVKTIIVHGDRNEVIETIPELEQIAADYRLHSEAPMLPKEVLQDIYKDGAVQIHGGYFGSCHLIVYKQVLDHFLRSGTEGLEISLNPDLIYACVSGREMLIGPNIFGGCWEELPHENNQDICRLSEATGILTPGKFEAFFLFYNPPSRLNSGIAYSVYVGNERMHREPRGILGWRAKKRASVKREFVLKVA